MRLKICIAILLISLLGYCHSRPRRDHNRHHNANGGGIIERGPGRRPGNKPTRSDKMTIKQVEDYLEKYQYMGDNCPDKVIGELTKVNKTMARKQAVKLFQRRYSRYGLTETGELDDDTLELMGKPRCGVVDLTSMGDMMKRKKRYLTTNYKWNKNELTYRINIYPRNDLGPKEVDREIARAFKVWEDVTPMRFRKVSYGTPGYVDINIIFVSGYHTAHDSYPFDGPGGTLAHAFFPFDDPIAGDSHFDDDETWTIDEYEGYSLFQVAAHEFGHALGLGHSTDPTALMAPFYPGYQPNFALPYDDVMGIQSIYGGPVGPREPTTTTTTTKAPTTTTSAQAPTTTTSRPGNPTDDNVCENAYFDAVTTIYENDRYKTYGFQGRYYFLIDPRTASVADSYPRLIRDSEVFAGIPDNVDAAFSWREEYTQDAYGKWYNKPAETFIFKGERYWKISNGIVEGPLSIVSGWGKDMPVDIDAAFVWGRNGQTYFVKGDKYYRYAKGYGIEPGFPRPSYEWGKLPIDAAMQYNNGRTYFFSGTKFWAYDDNNLRVVAGYPVDNRGLWFNCR